MNAELAVLQVLRVKGRAAPADLSAATGLHSDAVAAVLDPAVAEGLCEEKLGKIRLTSAGKDRVAMLAAAERAAIDPAAIATAYENFGVFNAAFKSLMHDWQLRDGAPNDHADAAYDGQIAERIADLHRQFAPLLRQLSDCVSRLGAYPARFEHALARCGEGDLAWVARPLIDSYHTVWFELHEDLIGLTGRTRLDEAMAGRAE